MTTMRRNNNGNKKIRKTDRILKENELVFTLLSVI